MREGVKGMVDDSKTLTSWALTLIGASIAIIVGTGYLRPPGKMRFIYFLFVPGWLLMGLCVYVGDKISRRSAPAAFTSKYDVLKQTASFINDDFDCQLTFLHVGLLFFLVWLLFFIFWWVLEKPVEQQTPPAGTAGVAGAPPGK